MHVAAEIGFWESPRVKRFCALTKDLGAGRYMMKLRELAILHHEDGQLEEEKPADLAAYVNWPGRPARLIELLVRVGFLLRGPLRLAGWDGPGDENGRYIAQRRYWRERKAEKRALERERQLAELRFAVGEQLNDNGVSNGHLMDVPFLSHGHPIDGGSPPSSPPSSQRAARRVSAAARVRRAPPEPPQRGGAREASPEGRNRAGRKALNVPWEWFAATYPKLQSPERCEELWAGLSDQERLHCQAVLPLQMASGRWRNERYIPFSDKYLSKKQFLAMRPPPPEKPPEKPRKKTTQELEAEAWNNRVNAMRIELSRKLRDRRMDYYQASAIAGQAIEELETLDGVDLEALAERLIHSPPP